MQHNILIPNLMVENVADTVQFYQDVLGFHLQVAMEHIAGAEPKMVMELTDGIQLEWANMVSEGAEFMFQERNSLIEDVPALAGVTIGASQTLYITLDKDIDRHYALMKDRVDVVVEPVSKFYGMREWYLKDCNGYILCFAQQLDNGLEQESP